MAGGEVRGGLEATPPFALEVEGKVVLAVGERGDIGVDVDRRNAGVPGVAGEGGIWLGGTGKESRSAGTGVRRDTEPVVVLMERREGEARPWVWRWESEETL